MLWKVKKKKLPGIHAQTHVANKGYSKTSANVFLQCAGKLLYFSLAFMFRETDTKETFLKELFKLWNPCLIKSQGPLPFWDF